MKINQHSFLCIAGLLFLAACDFAPRIHKKILNAQQLIKEQRYAESIREYQKILEKKPSERAKIYYMMGELYFIYLLENQKAIEAYNRAIEFSDDPVWMVKSQEKIGEINFSFSGDYEGAAKSYKKLVGFTPRLRRHDFYEYRLAMSYLNAGQLERGREVFQSIQNSGGHEYRIKSLYRMGMYHFLKKEWRMSIHYLNMYIEREKKRSDIVQAKFLMANAYEMTEDLKKAYDLYYAILPRYPNIDVVKNRLESIYSRRMARRR